MLLLSIFARKMFEVRYIIAFEGKSHVPFYFRVRAFRISWTRPSWCLEQAITKSGKFDLFQNAGKLSVAV